MKPPRLQLHRPETLESAVRLLASLENSRVIAGGQSLLPMLNFRVAQPDHLVDLSGVAELSYINEDSDEVRVGAMTTQRTIEFSDIVHRRLPLIAFTILSVGHRQTRNRGTIGGSLCHLDPSGELPLMAAIFDATIVVACASGEREMPISEFAVDTMTPALEPEELVREIRFKPWPAGHGWGFAEFARRKGDFAIVSAAAMMLVDEAGRIERVALALGGVAGVPIRILAAESELQGQRPYDGLIDRASAHCSEIEPLDDPFAPSWYRRKLAVSYARRALNQAWVQAVGYKE